MKIGDKVRFLSEVGGGTVSGFQGKNIVLVEDEDGFEIPMQVKDVIVIQPTDPPQPSLKGRESSASESLPPRGEVWRGAVPPREEAGRGAVSPRGDLEGAAPQKVWAGAPLERREGERLNLYLSFLPDDVKEITSTGVESYLVNDSNYYMQVSILCAEGAAWHLRFCGVVEPNSKLFVEAFDRSEVNDLERLCVQAIAWKQDKPFQLKPAISAELRLNLTKFYKLHVFHPNEFFKEPNWTEDIIRDDKPKKAVYCS